MSRSTSLHRNFAFAVACTGLLAAGVAAAQEAPAAASPTPAPAAEAPAAPTYHIDLVNKYILRGATSTYGNSLPTPGNSIADAPESDKPVLQWGADYVAPSGLYVGYFGSMINYSYQSLGRSYSNRSISDFQSNKSIENDIYGGYNGKLGEFGYVVGATGYVYINGKNANALETKLGVSYGDFSVLAQTLLNDVVWGNKGDTYFTLNFTKPVAYDLTVNASLGYYAYKKNGKYLGNTDTLTNTPCAAGSSFNVNGCYAGTGPSSGAFRHLIIGVTQPIAKTGLTWGLQGIIAGQNRFSIRQKDQLIASLSYGF